MEHFFQLKELALTLFSEKLVRFLLIYIFMHNFHLFLGFLVSHWINTYKIKEKINIQYKQLVEFIEW